MELNQFYWIKTESKSQKTKSKEIFVLGMCSDSSTNQSSVFNWVTRKESKWAKSKVAESQKRDGIQKRPYQKWTVQSEKIDGHLIINWTVKKVRQLTA